MYMYLDLNNFKYNKPKTINSTTYKWWVGGGYLLSMRF